LAISLAVLFAAAYVYSNDGGQEPYVPGQGVALAPDFSIVDTEGNAISLAQYRGSVVVLDFMATWCDPCKAQVDNLKDLYATHASRGVKIVSIDVELTDTVGRLHGYKLERGAAWPFALDTAGSYMEPEYSATSIPTVVIIDQQGKIVKRNVGVMTAAELAAAVNPLLGA
jgi:peroxiredoxin